MEIAEAYEDMMTVQGFKTMAKTILMVKLVVGVEWKPAAWEQCHQLPPSSELNSPERKREIGAHDFNRQSRMNSDRKFLKPKKGMTFDTGKMHNKRNNENKIAVTHIDRIQDY